MGLREWVGGLIQAVNTEYERRIKRASNVVTYGAHGYDVVDTAHEDDGDAEEAVIVNIPRGTPVRKDDSASRHSDAEG